MVDKNLYSRRDIRRRGDELLNIVLILTFTMHEEP